MRPVPSPRHLPAYLPPQNPTHQTESEFLDFYADSSFPFSGGEEKDKYKKLSQIDSFKVFSRVMFTVSWFKNELPRGLG